MDFKVKGADKLESLLSEITEQTAKKMQKELVEIGNDLKEEAQDLADKDIENFGVSAFSKTAELETTVGFIESASFEETEENIEKVTEYLETPFKENMQKYIKQIGVTVKKAVDKKA